MVDVTISVSKSWFRQTMQDFQYVWLVWSSAFLIPWAAIYVAAPKYRRFMVRRSLATMIFGLSEPIFVPRYWNPPSLFHLGQRTGFDIESFIFCFAIGGVGTVLTQIIMGQKAAADDERVRRLRWRIRAAALVTLVVLLPFRWSPMYAGIIAMGVGGIAKLCYFPRQRTGAVAGGVVFLLLYLLFLLGLKWTVPGYIQSVWNFKTLSAVRPLGLPLEELLFAFTFGMFWSRPP
jgi:hypothetical protein